MRKLIVICLFVLTFASSVVSSKSEVTYEIYYNDAMTNLIDIIEHIENTYDRVTMNVDKDDVDVMIRLNIKEFNTEETVITRFEANKIKIYLCNEDEVVFTYKGYLQDYCKNNIEKRSWFNVWKL